MRDLLNVEQFSFSTVVDLDPNAEGILFETGANVWGTILYQHDGVLYLQSGRGNGYGETAERGEASWQVTGGTATIEGSLDANGGLALMINGEVVDQSSFNTSLLAGGNPGSIAGANSGVAANRGGFNQNDAGYPGVTEVGSLRRSDDRSRAGAARLRQTGGGRTAPRLQSFGNSLFTCEQTSFLPEAIRDICSPVNKPDSTG